MGKEIRTTAIYGAVAVVLVALAMLTAPRQTTPDAFSDIGQALFPDFTDPNVARTLEVIDYDEETSSARPFKVTNAGSRWTIPSHFDYPADGKDRLARTAAAMIGVTKDDFRTDNPADYAACGVLDPMDDSPTASVKGRGKRVTIKGENDVVLADLVIGKSFEGREGFRLVRVAGQKRVYGVKIDVDVSTKFKDWIESDLMMIEQNEISGIVLKDYSIDERTGQINDRDEVMLKKNGEAWTANRLGKNQEVDTYKVGNLARAIDELAIEDVRTKPEGLSGSLGRGKESSMTQADMLSLQSRGYYFTRDGRLVSNEGELQVNTSDGVVYVLRFGEVAFGTEGGADDNAAPTGAKGVNRYLMITTAFDPTLFPEPKRPASTDFEQKPDSAWTEEDYRNRTAKDQWDRWKQKIESGQSRSSTLNDRFARWYYVISSESFDKLHLKRADLVKEKASG